jgi:hypothetical protein
MTGERALRAVISILWITAALIVMPGVGLLGYAIITNEDIPDLWQVIIGVVFQSLWFSVPASFLARGSRIARGFAIYASLVGLVLALLFTIGMAAIGALALALLGLPFVLAFAFSTWALIFYRDLREALDQRREKWAAAEKARLQELDDMMNEPAEK